MNEKMVEISRKLFYFRLILFSRFSWEIDVTPTQLVLNWKSNQIFFLSFQEFINLFRIQVDILFMGYFEENETKYKLRYETISVSITEW